MPTEIDYARLAAYLESEGCITVKKSNTHRRQLALQVSLVNTDCRLPLWCKETFGGHVWITKAAPHANMQKMTWGVGAKVAAELLRQCLPFFLFKREEAALAIAFQETKKYAGIGKFKPLPREIILQRQEIAEKLHNLKLVRPLMKVS